MLIQSLELSLWRIASTCLDNFDQSQRSSNQLKTGLLFYCWAAYQLTNECFNATLCNVSKPSSLGLRRVSFRMLSRREPDSTRAVCSGACASKPTWSLLTCFFRLGLHQCLVHPKVSFLLLHLEELLHHSYGKVHSLEGLQCNQGFTKF